MNNIMNTHKIDIGGKDIDIYVDGQLVLNIGQVSDKEVVNLFFIPKGSSHFVKHEKYGLKDDPVEVELLAERNKGGINIGFARTRTKSRRM